MAKNILILAAMAIIIALPFALRPAKQVPVGADVPTLVIVTPHNESIRYEFDQAFSEWHQRTYHTPVKIQWLAIGGTTEIMRYLASEFTSQTRAWWLSQGKAWPDGGSDILTAPKPPTSRPAQEELYKAFRNPDNDDPNKITARIDLFFGGGQFDHSDANSQGLTVPAWKPGQAPKEFSPSPDGTVLIPERLSGEIWRANTYYGTVVSAFGICYNLDRIEDLKKQSKWPLTRAPESWQDLADPGYFGQIGVADPTKSGSVAKAFEMIIHQKCHDIIAARGFSDSQIAQFEKAIADYKSQCDKAGKPYKPGDLPEGVPADYQKALEVGWQEGLFLVQRICANARYFTDSGSKVPIDVSMGDAAAGMAIDFYARFQAQYGPRGPDGKERMQYITPAGGSSVSCDPVSLLRGAPHRELAVRFIEFVLSEDGQRLWTYTPGEPGGPRKYPLRRLPIRRDFYPSTQPAIEAAHLRHESHAADDLADPRIDPFQIAKGFTYYPRWTGAHFGIQRDLIRVMCMDSGDELRRAWRAICDAGGESRVPRAMSWLHALPPLKLVNNKTQKEETVLINWRSAASIPKEYDRMDYLREWVSAFREDYRQAEREAKAVGSQ